MIVVGLMSGTSADGTDVAVVELSGSPPDLAWRLHHYETIVHAPALRAAILAATDPQTGTVDKLCRLNALLGEQLAQAALSGIFNAGLAVQDVDLIGSHGQTVWHDPRGDPPSTLQLGETAVIVERTGLPVVGNFRARDMAAGGQGAPLVAYVDILLLTHPVKIRAAQNIGGIGNVTFIPPNNRSDLRPLAFDTGPGNVLIDYIAARITNGEWTYDHEGQMAAQGQVDRRLLEWLLQRPYFHQPPPKTTGRELFTAAYAAEIWQRGRQEGLTPYDIAATVTALTAQSIANAYRDYFPALPDELIVSGGGAKNLTLMHLLSEALAPLELIISDEIGLNSDAKEALAFAILAYETWHGRSGNLPAATGANCAVILGQICRP
jgi:anhydro-N-acetylmuramic acid kinase